MICIDLFLAALGFIALGEQRLLFTVVRGLLVVPSLVEHRLYGAGVHVGADGCPGE